MTSKIWVLLLLALILTVAVTGCGSSPTTPTKPAVSPTVPVITQVITATPPPPTATPTVPAITPIPTLAVATAAPVSPTAAVKATVAGTPKPAATRKPTATATSAAPPPTVAVPLKYAAPRIVGPIFDLGTGRKDERHYPSDALILQWQSVGSLGGNECYLIRLDFVPGQGDSFLQCDAGLATQLGVGQTASFTLHQPNRGGPNYSALIPTNSGESMVNWYVQVVRDDGKGTGPATADGIRHNVTPLSPKSATVQFLLKGQ